HRLLPGAFVPRVRRSGARGQADGGCPGRADALSCRRNATTRRTRGDDAEMRHFRMLPACLALAACAGGAGMQPTDAAPRAALVEPAPIEAGQAPPPGPYAPGFDAVHYGIALTLPDTGSYIRGVTTARIAVGEPRAGTLPLDLSGLAVARVRVEGDADAQRHHAGMMHGPVPAAARVGGAITVEGAYEGRPDDGLTVGPNVHGRRTAFADTWPNRARFWFPSIDHPGDKATVA